MLGCLLAAPAGASLSTGFNFSPQTSGDSPAHLSIWAGRAASAGASVARMDVLWYAVAPIVRPRGFVASNPASPGYRWHQIDDAVTRLTARHLRVLITIVWAPRWAEGRNIPATASRGSWRPDPRQLAAFATAAARRYSGRFPDPAHAGRFLPRVSMWQAWNEPNLEYYLAPAWGPHGQLVSPGLYRAMLDDFYRAVKGVSRSNLVVMAGTAPYGDPYNCGCRIAYSRRIRPVLFYRSLFCLSGALLPLACPAPSYLDAIDHHPYQIPPPQVAAYWADDASVPDIWKITRVLRAAQRVGHVLPAGGKRVMVTELTWDSDPPSPAPGAAPLPVQACYYELSLYMLWSQGVDTVMFLQVHDRATRNFAESYQWGGIFFAGGRAKPSATAFSFPFVARWAAGGRAQLWGRAPQSGTLAISRETPNGWTAVARVPVRAGQTFLVTVPWPGSLVARAQVGSAKSLPWTWGSATCPTH